jgi:enoyl-CoA hydratase/carnithine racemase
MKEPSTATVPQLGTVALSLDAGVARIRLNRPGKANALDLPMWDDLRSAIRWVDRTPAVRVAILEAAGAHFTAGLDLSVFATLKERMQAAGCEGRAREALRQSILDLQDVVTGLERCPKPFIASVHAACVGGGIDIISACDLRYCSAEAWFSVKEIDIGMVADVGTLQRLPRLVGEGMARELAFSGRRVDGREAASLRLVNRCFDGPEALRDGVDEMARTLAAKSPLALRGTKQVMNHAREHATLDGLEHVATWNAAMMLSGDLDEALSAARERRSPLFPD